MTWRVKFEKWWTGLKRWLILRDGWPKLPAELGRVIDARAVSEAEDINRCTAIKGKEMPLLGAEHRMGGEEGDEASGREGRRDAEGGGRSETAPSGSVSS